MPGETRSTQPPSATSENREEEVEATGPRVTAWQLRDQKVCNDPPEEVTGRQKGAGGYGTPVRLRRDGWKHNGT
ncbi:hypothetical protein NDU88_003815 [Pleurodeles waltl]|uniref:Uncharacterized protein n=1 Tax=Pleurodeles waltl TaxID=8319 RepID=A0AAV7SH07_PLEWA|nr:hypothetical protein NDU88_003815 [Pleurodeles waltl]